MESGSKQLTWAKGALLPGKTLQFGPGSPRWGLRRGFGTGGPLVPSSRRKTEEAAAAVEGWKRELRRRCLAASMREEGRMALPGDCDGDAYGWR